MRKFKDIDELYSWVGNDEIFHAIMNTGNVTVNSYSVEITDSIAHDVTLYHVVRDYNALRRK